MKAVVFKVLIALALLVLAGPPMYLKEPLPEDDPTVHRYTHAAEDAVEAIELEMPGATWEAREKYARLIYVWSYFEASWAQNPYGCKPGTEKKLASGIIRHCLAGGVWEDTNDGGMACGIGQVHVDTIQALPGWKGVLEPAW